MLSLSLSLSLSVCDVLSNLDDDSFTIFIRPFFFSLREPIWPLWGEE